MQVPQTVKQVYGLTPHFYLEQMPPPNHEFVCWLDLMGMQNAMLRSLPNTANFAMKLLVAVTGPQSHLPQSVSVCPVIDGLFMHSPSRDDLLLAVKRGIARLAMACIGTPGPDQAFLVRAAIAYGPLVNGASIPEPCFRPEAYQGTGPTRPVQADRVIFGFGVSRAYTASHVAPPFGVVIDSSATESALLGSGIACDGLLWHWWKHRTHDVDEWLARWLKRRVSEYLDWCGERPAQTGYEPQRLAAHRALFDEYYMGIGEPVEEPAV